MKRRTFFIGTGAVATISLISIGSFNYWLYSDEDETVVLNPFIKDFLPDESLTKIVRDYQNKNQNIKDIGDDVKEVKRNKIIRDFESNNLTICDGWVLSETEVNYLLKEIK